MRKFSHITQTRKANTKADAVSNRFRSTIPHQKANRKKLKKTVEFKKEFNFSIKE